MNPSCPTNSSGLDLPLHLGPPYAPLQDWQDSLDSGLDTIVVALDIA
ncbi:hypothetical protein Pmani_034429, partial [Petrolisthes manimaculis]